MAKTKLQDMTVEQLKEKEKGLKVLIGIFIPLITALFFFVIRDYVNGDEVDWSILTIAICTLAGPITLYPELQHVRKEIETRS
ncbi:MAG: hypothetical protein P1U56_18280 [Saprospiraceae bacterium]|nr:hypothetical protein [Saprospiraceae bacterium]